MGLRELSEEAKEEVAEEVVLFVSIMKWVVLAAFIGMIVGLSTSIFLMLLSGGTDYAKTFDGYFYLLPAAFFLSAAAVKYLSPEAEGHGTEKVIEAVNKKYGRINPFVAPVKLFSTIVTIAFGGSAGKEGPAAQIGAALASSFAGILRFDDHDRKKLVICGISAGFASVFGTPIAGAIFGVEVLTAGCILYEVLLPSFIAGIVGYQVSSALGITHFHHSLDFVPKFSGSLFAEIVLAGIFFGICSMVLIELLDLGKKAYGKINVWNPLKAAFGGALLLALALGFSTDYLGLGLPGIESSLSGEPADKEAFLLKTLFTSVTLGFGGSGGVITPIFFIGATAGNTFAQIFGLDLATFSAIGLVSLLAGAANTPIAASILAVELFGPEISAYAAIACVISFLMTGHRSVYPSQLLAIKKSSSIDVEIGGEMEDADPHPHLRHAGLISSFSRAMKKR